MGTHQSETQKISIIEKMSLELSNTIPLINGPVVTLKKVDTPAQRLRKICSNGLDFVDRYDHVKRHLYIRGRLDRVCGRMETRLEQKCVDLTWPPRYRRTTDEDEKKEIDNEVNSLFEPQPRGNERGASETISRIITQLKRWVDNHLRDCRNYSNHHTRIERQLENRFIRLNNLS